MRSLKSAWSIGAAAFLIQPQQLESQQALPSTGRILVLWEPDAVSLPPGETEATPDKVKVGKTKLRGIVNQNRVKLVRQLHKEWKASDVPLPYKVRARKKGDTVMPDELSDLSYWHVLEVTDTTRMAAMIDELNASDGVVVAEPDGYIHLAAPRVTAPSGLFSRLAALIPNDPSFGNQWGLYNPSNRSGDIRAPEAWDMQTGRSGTRIAFMDSGTEQANVDFQGGNHVSDYDFVHNDGNAYPDLTGHNSPGHGTSVAGIAAARTNEGAGAAGVCGGNGASLGCSILTAKILGDLSVTQAITEWLGLTSMAADAVNWSVSSSASVINNSWCADRGVFGISGDRATHDAMRNAHGMGVLLTAAMGNSDGGCGMTAPDQAVAPAAWSDIVMSVGASTSSGTRVTLASTGNQWQSGTGPHISVIAPGLGSYAPRLGLPPGSFSGTSAATPFVSGLAGLLRSESTDNGLNLTSVDIRKIIEGTATDKDIFGHDVNTGWGLINAEKALRTLNPPNQLDFVSLGPVTSTCFAQLPITNWTFWADWAVLQARRCELRRTVTFAKRYTTIPVVWGRPITNGGVTPSNPNSQVYFTGVVPGSATTTGVTLRTYVYERWNLSGTSLGWYPVAPSQVNWAYGVAGQPAPFTVTAGAPGQVTVKATYALTGSANYPATAWRWDRDDDGFAYTLWANAQNSQFIAYAGQYTINWRLFARRTSDAVTDYGYASTIVCIPASSCPLNIMAADRPGSPSPVPAQPASVVAIQPGPASRVKAGHFGAGPWISRDGDNRAVQFYSLSGQHDVVQEANPWPNSFALVAGVPARRSAARDSGSTALTERLAKPSPSVTSIALAGDRVKKGGAYRVSYAVDPDLGAWPADDKLSWIDSLGVVVVTDPDSGAVAYGWSTTPAGARASVREYANADELLEPGSPEEAYREQRANSRAIGSAGDVRFVLTLGPLTISGSRRPEATLLSASGRGLSEALANLLNERARATPEAEIAGEGESGGPQAFALRQQLGGGHAAALSMAGTEGAAASLTARAQLRQFGITALGYAVPAGQTVNVRIRLYSSAGQLVRNLVNEQKSAGDYQVEWDALNERGEKVAPGVYLAVMEAGTFKASRKLVITR